MSNITFFGTIFRKFFFCSNRKLDLLLKRRNGMFICEKTVSLCNNYEQMMK